MTQSVGNTLEIQGEHFEVISLTGNTVHYRRVRSEGIVHIYEAVGERPAHTLPPLVFLQAEDGNSLPHSITVNGREFHKWLGSTFVPDDISPEKTELYFDLLAPQYHDVAALNLNAEVYQRFLKSIETRFGQGNIKLFDFGIGTGEALGSVLKRRMRRQNMLIDRLELAGGDMSDGMLKQVSAHLPPAFANIALYKCGYAHVPVPDASFDAVTACFVTHYFVDKRPFDEIHRILKPGGLFIFNAYQPSGTAMGPESQAYRATLETCGFRAIHTPRQPQLIAYLDEQGKPEQRNVTIISATASAK